MPSIDELVKKYANKTPEEMELEQDKIEQDYMVQSRALEQKILEASSKIDEMKIGEETVARVKRPTKEQMNRILPPELAKYRKNPEEVPYEVAKKYETEMYQLMEELIVMPKHDSEWWIKNTGDDFMAAFQAHIANTQSQIQKDTERFLRQTSDTPS
jgi:hypothetical protein